MTDHTSHVSALVMIPSLTTTRYSVWAKTCQLLRAKWAENQKYLLTIGFYLLFSRRITKSGGKMSAKFE